MTSERTYVDYLEDILDATEKVAQFIQGMTYEQLGIESPGITPEMRQMTLKQAWYPMIPIEQMQKVQMLTLRLQAGGISLETYLDKLGEDDIPQEIERIWTDREREMRIEAAIKAGMTKTKEKGIAGNPGNFDRQEGG